VSRIDPRVDWERAHIFGASGVGIGPVYPGLGAQHGEVRADEDVQFGGPWYGEKVFWYVRPDYRGPVLIRGRRLDGPELLGFNGDRRPDRELRIRPGETVTWQGQPARSRGLPSAVRIRRAGCYGIQIDGTSFSYAVVVRATLAR
jgi:hypothetical protein